MEKSLLGVQVMSYVQYSCEDAAVQTGTQIQLQVLIHSAPVWLVLLARIYLSSGEDRKIKNSCSIGRANLQAVQDLKGRASNPTL